MGLELWVTQEEGKQVVPPVCLDRPQQKVCYRAEDETGDLDLEEQREKLAYLLPGHSGLWVARD